MHLRIARSEPVDSGFYDAVADRVRDADGHKRETKDNDGFPFLGPDKEQDRDQGRNDPEQAVGDNGKNKVKDRVSDCIVEENKKSRIESDNGFEH